MALQIKIDLGASERLFIIVEPVVVIPDILSKNESVKDKLSSEKIKGKEPNIAMLNQAKLVSKNACCKFKDLSFLKFDKKNKIPNIIVIIEDDKKDVSSSEYNNCTNIGIDIETPRMICKIPSV